MGKSLHGGGVDFPLRAPSDQLRTDLEQGKQLVKQAAQEMRATANLSIASPTQLGSSTASAKFESNVQAKMARMQEMSVSRAENNRIATAARNRLGIMQPGEQREMNRFLADEASARNADLGAGASYRGRGALVRTNPRAAGGGFNIMGMNPAYLAAGGLGVAAAVAGGMARGMADEHNQRLHERMDVDFLRGERGVFARTGGNTAGLDADIRLRQSQGIKERREIFQNDVPILGSIARFMSKIDGATAALDKEIKVRERAVAVTYAAIESQRESTLRVAEFKFGQRQNPLAVLQARQKDEIEQLERAFAKDPTNVEAGIALDRRRQAQGQEKEFNVNVEAVRQRRIGTNAQAERYRGAEAIARLRGHGTQEFAARRVREMEEMEQSYRERIVNATPEEARTLKEQRNQARFNFQLETQIEARDLSLGRSGKSGSAADAGIFGRLNRERYSGEQRNLAAMSDEAMRQLSAALQENTEAMKRRGEQWNDD
jgi:hypothetical protein